MPPDPVEREAWVALGAVAGVGDVTFERALTTYGSAAGALAGIAALRATDGDRRLAAALGMRVADGLHGRILAAARDPGATARAVRTLGGWTLTPLDAGYPDRLDVLADPPRVLFGLGEPRAMEAARSVAIVGTRHPTALGRTLAGRIATRLVEAGATVVSGLAIGIDAAAHAATLDAGGRTVAVVGGGLDAPGPATNARLARAVVERGGAIVSEHAPGVAPTRGTFPRRNRLISALAGGTLVVEAPARSGALITAHHALEQGRPLVVVPGRPTDHASAGCLRLLRETPAQPYVGLDELLVDLGLEGGADGGTDIGGLPLAGALALLPELERAVAQTLVAGPQTVDTIVDRLGTEAGAVSGALMMLQLRGWARLHGSMHLPAGPLLQG